jgi:(1->4)-alpha-D-glucan 1-alpha-D-glucosylmutase
MCALSNTLSLGDAFDRIAQQRRIPAATYRLQFNKDFTFEQARAIVDYLDELGISDVYASPLLRSCAGSPHGYDICDHNSFNPEMGGEAAFREFAAALLARRMGLVLDVVPNHMGIGEPANTWWMDVMENGPASHRAETFDIDWQPVKRELEGKVLLPVLEDQYGKVLEAGKLLLSYQDGTFILSYYETRLPIAPETYRGILGARLGELKERLGEGNEHVQELESIGTALGYLPPRTFLSPEKMAERGREKEVIKRRLATLVAASPDVAAAIEESVALYNGKVGDPRSFDLLDDLLERQSYRLAFWRVASDEINYRRFFDINKLAAIRIELPSVFRAAHALIFRLLTEGQVTALRVDHPDGLWNPGKYFRWLQEACLFHKLRAETDAPPEALEQEVCAWLEAHLVHQDKPGAAWPLYVVAEKILSEKEPLPENWAVAGTTGYDFMNQVNGIFVDRASRKNFDKIYAWFLGESLNFRDLVNSSKKMIMTTSLASEVGALSHQLERLAERNRLYRDFTLNSLRMAIRDVIACLPIYRTYVVDSTAAVDPRDVHYVESAVNEARRRNQRTAQEIYDFIRDTLLLRNLANFHESDHPRVLEFVMKFQQVTGPVMAKGLEDTAFYIYNRLVSLNEVGGHPQAFGEPLQEFHERNRERFRHWPYSLLATSTHDTKRGEDVRARIDVLSEIPSEWRAALGRWSRLNQRKKKTVDGEPAPSRNDEYLLYQTLVGAWPGEPLEGAALENFRNRIIEYMTKATKEAKQRTSWVNPNAPYDAAVREFIEALFSAKPNKKFLASLEAFARRVAFFGQFNSLAQTLLKLTAPGVPDFYQGTELWNLALVDPDNRRPVDYETRRAMLAELKRRIEQAGGDLAPLARELLAASPDGRIKMYLVHRALRLRRERDPLFKDGDYLPLEVAGAKREHALAFARRLGGEVAITIVPRLVVRLTGGAETPPLGEAVWQDTRVLLPADLAGRRWSNLFTGQAIEAPAEDSAAALPLKDALADFPVALLT